MELQHINVKLFVKKPKEVDLGPLIQIFQNWIQDPENGELLLDVADYRHVVAGPGVILIGHEGDYSVDNTDGRLGVRYNRKAALDGTNQDRLRQAMRAALIACGRLEAEPSMGGRLRFNGQEIEIFVNDRLLAPNSVETRDAIKADIQALAQQLFGGVEYAVSYDRDPRRLFTVSMRAAKPFSAADLFQRLS